MVKIVVTGGAGFIGSNLLNMLAPRHPEHTFVNVDSLTYAGNPLNLTDVAPLPNYRIERVDLAQADAVRDLFHRHRPDWVIHLAAESHVDRSISSPGAFIQTNIIGTYHLLEACRSLWGDSGGHVFHHVSTDEVYGSLGDQGYFTEETRYDPSSPYSASKASSDHLVRAYHRTYGLPVKVTNCSNNYGPYQFPEKLIPLMIARALDGQPLPVYGDGKNVRDWLYVTDHCEAIWTVARQGRVGETYNIGGNSERSNIDVVRTLCRILGEETGRPLETYESLISFVKDRPGHDQRYAIDASKIKAELGWEPVESFDTGLKKTVSWYLSHQEWVRQVQTGEYREWIQAQYEDRTPAASAS
jgi:dTDP-glucose 4,6-dehydratase